MRKRALSADLRYWIWLGAALGYASPALLPLLERFEDAEGVFHASEEELLEIKELHREERKHLALHDLSRAEEVAEYCMHAGVRVLTIAEEDYPQALLTIKNPPAVLYMRGTLPEWNTRPCIAVVGARAMSYYGAASACEIAYDLGRMGCITVSGMALGVDGTVAAATLEANGKTVAVLGSGIDRIYPKAHKALYKAILAGGGAIITEFPPYEGADAFHFPLRNRIISGIAKAMILVEGDASSGALITARYAKKQGRSVFAVPGKINDKNSEAPLLLKRDATLLTCADDIYDTFKEEYFSSLNPFALLPKHTVSPEAIIRKYGVAVGREKKKEKPLLGQTEDNGKPQLVQKIRRIFGAKAEAEETKASPEPLTAENPVDSAEIRRALDEERRKKLSPFEYSIYEKLSFDDPKHPDELSSRALAIKDISAQLVMMEILGYVTLVPGGRYLKNENQ